MEEEEEAMSKPLRFSTPGARCLSGDAARHLGPSPSSQGTGDGIVPQRWPRGAPRPLRCPRVGGGGGAQRIPGTRSRAALAVQWQRVRALRACGAGVEGEDGKVVI